MKNRGYVKNAGGKIQFGKEFYCNKIKVESTFFFFFCMLYG